MRNEDSVFPREIDPHIFFSDASLDNYQLLNTYYSYLDAKQYIQASEYLQSIDEQADIYGAWLLNLIENELYAIESNIGTFVTENNKPKLTYHCVNPPTDPEFKTWVYCDIDPGIPSVSSLPRWWYNSPDVCPVQKIWSDDEEYLYPYVDYDYYFDEYNIAPITYTNFTERGIAGEEITNIIPEIPEDGYESDDYYTDFTIPLYDSEDNLSEMYRLVFRILWISSYKPTDNYSGYISMSPSFILFDRDNNIMFRKRGETNSKTYYSDLHVYTFAGADTFYSSSGENSYNGLIYGAVIYTGNETLHEKEPDYIYIGNAIPISYLEPYGVHLGNDWYTPTPTNLPFYWRYTPPGYIDDCAPYLGTWHDWYLDSRIMARGLGQSSIEDATDDLGTGATKIDDPTIYPSSDTRDYNYVIPLYNEDNGELSTYELRIGLRYNLNNLNRFGAKIMFYNGSEILGSTSSGIPNSYLTNGTKDFEYYIFGGSGMSWATNSPLFYSFRNSLYICTVVKCRDNDSNLEIAYAMCGVDLEYLRDSYGLIVSKEYFNYNTGNNINPKYPPDTYT